MNKELEEAKKQIRTTRKLATFFVGLMCVLLFAIIALVIWAVIQTQQTPTSFAECVTYKDAKILESYPEQCVVDGKSFTNPNQNIEEITQEPEAVSAEKWVEYTPDDELYTIKLIDGWNFEYYKVGKQTVLTGCVNDCVYSKGTPAQLVSRTGKVNEAAKLKVTYGEEPVLAATYLNAGYVELNAGGTAARYVFNDGKNSTYVYVVKGAENTVTLTYVQPNDAPVNSIPYIDEMVASITTQ